MEKPKKKKRDVDSADIALRGYALAWSFTGAFLGGAMMVLVDVWADRMDYPWTSHPGLMILGGAVFGFVFAYFVSTRLTQKTAETIGGIYAPSGSTTPPVREYSRARALTMQGKYEQAAAAWEIHVTEHPDDPVPYLESARLYRNDLHDLEQAVRWYKRAMDESRISGGQLLLATQEITEIYRHKLNQPRKAIPYLADFVSKYPDDPHVEGAKAQLEELRELIRAEDEI
jgi:tetratricopeptide (TPR) repeat protein